MGQAVAVLCAHGLAALWHVWRRVWRPGAKLGVRCPLTTPHATIFHRSPTSVKRVARSWPPSPITSCRAYSHQTRSSPRTTASGECRHTYHFQRPTFNKILFKPVSRFSSASHPPLIRLSSPPLRTLSVVSSTAAWRLAWALSLSRESSGGMTLCFTLSYSEIGSRRSR